MINLYARTNTGSGAGEGSEQSIPTLVEFWDLFEPSELVDGIEKQGAWAMRAGAEDLGGIINDIPTVGLRLGGHTEVFSTVQHPLELPDLWIDISSPATLFSTLGDIVSWYSAYHRACLDGMQTPIPWYSKQDTSLVRALCHRMCRSDFADPETYFAGWRYALTHNTFKDYIGTCELEGLPFSACQLKAAFTNSAAYETPYTLSFEFHDGQNVTPGHNVRYILTSPTSAEVFAIQAPEINGWTEGNLKRIRDELPAEAASAYAHMSRYNEDRGMTFDQLALFLLHDNLTQYIENPTPLDTLHAVRTLRTFAQWHMVEDNKIVLANTLQRFDFVRRSRSKLNRHCKLRGSSPSVVASLTATIGLFASRGITSIKVPLVLPLLRHAENEKDFDLHRANATYKAVENVARLVKGVSMELADDGEMITVEIDPVKLDSENKFLAQLLNMHEVIRSLD